jgi:hypothetical protein
MGVWDLPGIKSEISLNREDSSWVGLNGGHAAYQLAHPER